MAGSVGGIKLLFVLCSLFCVAYSGSHKTILISCDAFRWDYMQLHGTPNLLALIAKGTFANHGIRNQYVTITVPNHVTLATGRFNDDHGMIGNDMWDPVLKETFEAWGEVNGTEGNVDDGNFEKDTRWLNNSAEPIWVTLARQNVGKAAVIMWPLASYYYHGASADFYVPWDSSVAYERRIDTLLPRLVNPDYTLGVLYFEELDNVGHSYGPNSPQIVTAIKRIDEVIGYLMTSLSKAGITDFDLIITADHGMSEVDSNKVIYLPQFVDTSKITVYDATIWVQPGYEDAVFQNLSQANNLRVYHQWEVTPASEHFSHNRRIFDLVYFLDDGYYFSWSSPSGVRPIGEIVVNDKRSTKRPPRGVSVWGDHGYDNRYANMYPTFIAFGKSFGSGVTVKPFNNTQVYCMICAINKVDPHPQADCNSSLTQALLKEALADPPMTWPSFLHKERTMSASEIEQLLSEILHIDNMNSSTERPLLAVVLVSMGAAFMFLFVVVLICRLTTVRKAQRSKLVIGHPVGNRKAGCYRAATCGNNRPVYRPHAIYAIDEEVAIDSDDELLAE